MKELKLTRCNQLTDEAFNRCSALNRLIVLDLSYISKKITGQFLHCFTTSPLVTLILDGIIFKSNVANDKATAKLTRSMSRKDRLLLEDSKIPKWLQALQGLSDTTRLSLNSVSMRDCPHVENEDISFLLQELIHCTMIDISGSGYTFPGSLETIRSTHPFLRLCVNNSFIGYKEDFVTRLKHAKFNHKIDMYKRHR